MYDGIIIKAGTTELTEQDAQRIYNNKKYVVNYSGVFQPHYSAAQNQVYFSKVINIKGIAKRGRFYEMDAKTINNIIGHELLIV
jgi:hypothetical protein